MDYKFEFPKKPEIPTDKSKHNDGDIFIGILIALLYINENC